MQLPTVREIVCTPDDSSVIRELRIFVKNHNDLSSVNVVFESGAEYYYPALDNDTIAKCLFADSIGSVFNKLVAQNDKIRYSKLN
jgi:hypothetical protein